MRRVGGLVTLQHTRQEGRGKVGGVGRDESREGVFEGSLHSPHPEYRVPYIPIRLEWIHYDQSMAWLTQIEICPNEDLCERERERERDNIPSIKQGDTHLIEVELHPEEPQESEESGTEIFFFGKIGSCSSRGGRSIVATVGLARAWLWHIVAQEGYYHQYQTITAYPS